MPFLGDNDITLKLTVEGDSGGIKKVGDEIDSFEKRISGAENRLNSFNKAFQGMAAVGAIATGVIAGSVKAAVDWESAFAGVRKTVDASEEEFAKLSEGIKAMSKEIPVSAGELAGLGEVAGSLGVEGTDNILKFIKVTAAMGVSTNLAAETAATEFARIANVMQVPIERVDRMGSSVVELGNKFATTESEIVAFASRIAGAGKIAGLSAEDVFGIAAAFSSVGIEAEAGGTAVQKVLLKMNEAVNQGTDELELFAAVSGMTASEFKSTWEEGANGAFIAFVNGLGAAGKDAGKVLEELELQDERLIRAFLSLANAGDLVNQTARVSGEAWQENNALTEEAAKRYETTAAQLQLLWNNLTLVGITLGEQFLPVVNSLISDHLIPLSEHLNGWIEKHPQLTQGILSTALAIGGAGVAGLTLIPAILNWIKLIQFLIPLIQGLAIAMMGPWGLAIAAISLAVVGLYVAWKENMLGIRNITQDVVNFVIDRLNSVIRLINSIVGMANRLTGNSIQQIGPVEHVNFSGGGEATSSGGASGSWLNYTPASLQTPAQPQTSGNGGPTINQTNNIYSSVDVNMLLRDITFATNTR
jgi:TP901 family phage tail tape measure protein